MEFDLIERIRRRVVARGDVVLGIGDDAAVLALPPGRQLVVAMDTLNAGVHFPIGTPAADIGWKALAVNLSDLAAMGATPAWCTLSLSMPAADAAWLDDFLDGFSMLAAQHDVALVGGDTTRGPLSVCVTVHGFVEPGGALRRDGARIGDDVWVSGTPGDAAAGLVLAGIAMAGVARIDAAHEDRDALAARLARPQPRVALGGALVGLANACLDISDGLLADAAHVARASDVALRIDIDALPASAALARCVDTDTRRVLQATGGDDYELLFTAPASARDAIDAMSCHGGIPATRIGRAVAGEGVQAVDADGRDWRPAHAGYQHFADQR
ncbi:MAG TPA: thiamine-phosphate kinase [Lysobacter sp.]|nr:thiamine-phosphate kinase [Lysobacter sp.]